MKDPSGTNQELIEEISILKQRIQELEQSEAKRKQAEQELMSTITRTDFLLTSTPVMIYSCKTSGDFGATFISENVEDYLGYQAIEFINTPEFWANHIHPEDAPRVFAELPLLFEKGCHTLEYRFQNKSGEYRWMHDKLTLIQDKSGEPIEIIGAWIDITESKKAEEALRESEARHRSIVKDQTELICRYLPDGRLSFVNDAYIRYYGKSEAELINRNFIPHIPAADMTMVLEHTSGITRNAPLVTFEHRIVLPDGEMRWQAWTHRGVYTADGRLIEYQAVGRDITDRKKAEEKIIRLNRVYSVISQINQAIVRAQEKDELLNKVCHIAVEYGKFQMAWVGMIDEEANLVKPVAYSGFEDGYLSRIKEISVDDVPAGRGPTGTAIREDRYYVCNDIDKDARMALWSEEARKRGYRSSIALPIRQFGKVIGAFDLYASIPHFFNLEEINLLDEVTNNISYAIESIEKGKKSIEAEAEHRKAEEKLKASLQEKEMLLEEIHHRVKNNLQVISSLLDLQSSRLQDEKAREAFRESIAQVRTMAMIHTQLYQSQDVSKVDFGPFILNLIDKIRQSYERAKSPMEINVDTEEIRLGIDTSIPCGLILNELFTNALKHAFPEGSGGRIDISMKREGNHYILKVQDNGIGFHEPTDLTKTLGMQLVNVLVRQLHGKINVEVAGGTSFAITFPVRKD